REIIGTEFRRQLAQVGLQRKLILLVRGSTPGDDLGKDMGLLANTLRNEIVDGANRHVLGGIDTEAGDAETLQSGEIVPLLADHIAVAEQIGQTGIARASAEPPVLHLPDIVVVVDAVR
ncbi:MAG: hypothetical protein ACK56I_31595, partial [bacterium]